MDKNKRADLLKDEYVMLQSFYEEMDTKGLNIKYWTITIAGAAIVAGIQSRSSLILAVAFGASLMFWYLEAYWRGLSHFFVARINEIEAFFKDEESSKAAPLQFYNKWREEYAKSGDQTFRYIMKTTVVIPHAIIAVLSLVILILSLYGYLK